MAVDPRDREYLRRLGALQDQGARERAAAHAALDADARLARSFELARRTWDEATRARRVDDPAAFYERARALGLYRP